MTPEELKEKRRINSKNYYDRKKRKPKRTPEEELEFREKQRQHQNEYSKLHHQRTYVKKHIPKTEEEKKEKAKEYAKKYYDKINANQVKNPRVKSEHKKVVLHKKEVIREVNYLNNTELYYWIVISQGEGKLSVKAFELLMQIVEQVAKKFIYRCEQDREDIIQSGKLKLLEKWMKFDCNKYSNCLAYYTELAKRSMAFQYNVLMGKHNQHQELPKMISLSKWNQ